MLVESVMGLLLNMRSIPIVCLKFCTVLGSAHSNTVLIGSSINIFLNMDAECEKGKTFTTVWKVFDNPPIGIRIPARKPINVPKMELNSE